MNMTNRGCFKLNKLICSVSLMLTFKVTWARPLSEDTWIPLMLNQSGESSVSTSSKGASEKRRLTQYVTNTLDDNFKGTTEQFVFHFNEQFMQLDEISDDSEKLALTVKLALLQTAVRSINNLRIVETLDEFQSTTILHIPVIPNIL